MFARLAGLKTMSAAKSGFKPVQENPTPGRANDSGKNRAHTDNGKGADGIRRVVKHSNINVTNRATQHGAHEKRWGKDSAGSAARIGTNCGDQFEHAKSHHRQHRQRVHRSGQCQRKSLVRIASDAVQVKQRQRHHGQAARGQSSDGRMHPFGNGCQALESGTQPEQRFREGDRNNRRQQAKTDKRKHRPMNPISEDLDIPRLFSERRHRPRQDRQWQRRIIRQKAGGGAGSGSNSSSAFCGSPVKVYS